MRQVNHHVIFLLMVIVCLFAEIFNSSFVNGDCVWKFLPKCKTPRKNYRPKTNGCGPQQQLLSGIINVVTSSVSREFAECCNQHDRCYGQCGISKSDCDKQFRECMINKCYLDLACRLKAFSLFNAVEKPSPWSCRAYIGGQIEACDCSAPPPTPPQPQPKESLPPTPPQPEESLTPTPQPTGPGVKLIKLKVN